MRKLLLFSYFFFLYFFSVQPQQYLPLMNPKKNWISFFNTLKAYYPIDSFVESGTYLGKTALQASQCFTNVYTIEVSSDYYYQAQETLKGTNNVMIYLGDSAKILPQLLPNLRRKNEKILFWLDGHFMSSMIGEQDIVLSEYGYTPIVAELQAIINNKINDAIILIDDIRLFRTILNGVSIEQVGNAYYPFLRDIVNLLHQNGFISVIYGDMLCAYHQTNSLLFSPLVKACTISRLFDGANYTIDIILQAEYLISQAKYEEAEALHDLYTEFSMPWKLWRNKNPHYNLWYGLILQCKNQHEKACNQFDEVIQLGYNHWRIFWYKAKSLFEISDFEGVRTTLNELFAQKKDFKPAIQLLDKINNI